MSSRTFHWLNLFFLIPCLNGCSLSFQRWQYTSALKLAENKRYADAVDRFSKVVRRAPDRPIALEASRRAARVAEFDLKNYGKAAEFYRMLVLHSPDAQERISAQKALADIYSDKLMNYDQAVVEFNRLLPLLPAKERPPFQLAMAKAEMNLNNFSQALIEVDGLLSNRLSTDLHYEAMMFKANLLQAAKRPKEAVTVLEAIMEKFPNESEKEYLGVSLAVVLEEIGDFHRAVEVLEKLKAHYPNPEFIENRVRQLRERMANLPGAQGVKR